MGNLTKNEIQRRWRPIFWGLVLVLAATILILDGDKRQIDKRAFEKDNGLYTAIDRLKGNRLFGYVHLKESVRSETAKLADLLDKKEDDK